VCEETINHNYKYQFSEKEPSRQWKVHSCFHPCKLKESEMEKGFTLDGREVCKDEKQRQNGVICVNPSESCEIYTRASQICFDTNFEICIDYMTILYSVIISCCLHTMFDASLLYSFEVTFKPTKLDLMFDPEL